MRYDPFRHPPHTRAHRMIPLECRHRIEIEIYPASAQVYFADERFVDPACTQQRFDATVFNSETANVLWSVESLNGGLGAGAIDSRGLYCAPTKNGHDLSFSEIIVARPVENPSRRATAIITVAGHGPLPPPKPVLRISPRRCTVYRKEALPHERFNNEYIDRGNYSQTFVAQVYHSASPLIWKVDTIINALPASSDSKTFTYTANSSTALGNHRIKAELSTDPTVFDEIEVIVADYAWGGIWG